MTVDQKHPELSDRYRDFFRSKGFNGKDLSTWIKVAKGELKEEQVTGPIKVPQERGQSIKVYEAARFSEQNVMLMIGGRDAGQISMQCLTKIGLQRRKSPLILHAEKLKSKQS